MAWRGTYILGTQAVLGCQCVNAAGTPTAPDSAPTMKIYTATGTSSVVSKSIPPRDKFNSTGYFEYQQPLNSLFSTGLYYVLYTWTISSTTYTQADVDVFRIVAGGDNTGSVISMFYLDRPDGNDFILAQLDMGSVVWHRGPSVS